MVLSCHVFAVTEPVIFFGSVEHEVVSELNRVFGPKKISVIGAGNIISKPVQETVIVTRFQTL